LNEGTIASSRGDRWAVEDFEQEFGERHVPHSTALHALRRSTGDGYFLGPLARVHLSFDRLSPAARRTADEIGFQLPCRNPFRSIIARGLELIHVYEEALSILRAYRPPTKVRIEGASCAGEGCAATEAPRGLLYHRYQVDAEGKIALAKIVPPTSQNQHQMESDLAGWVSRVLGESDDAAARSCERVLRCYDPCISCSTHFLRVRWERK